MTDETDETRILFGEDFLRRLDVLYLTARRLSQGTQQATRASKKLGAGVEVADFRRYSRGDDVRSIDWNYYASARELLVRLFEEDEDLHIYFLIDVSASMFLDSSVRYAHAARLAAALGYIGLANLDRVSIVAFDHAVRARLPASRGRAQIWNLLRFLEALEPGTTTDMGAAFEAFVRETRRRGLVVILSDFFDPGGCERALNLLRYNRYETILLPIIRNADRNPALGGDVEFRDAETDESVRVRVTPRVLRRYRDAYDRYWDAIETIARQHRSLCFRAPIETAFDDLVLRVLRGGGFLR